MKSTLRLILKNKIFKLLFLLILVLLVVQLIVASYAISNNPTAISLNKEMISIHKKNISMIKLLLSYQGDAVGNTMFFDFKFNVVKAYFSNKPVCKVHLSRRDLDNYSICDRKFCFHVPNCISIRSTKLGWLNYISRPSLPRGKELLFANLITAVFIIIIIILCWFLLKVIIPARKLEDNVYELGMSLVKKDIKVNGVSFLGSFANSINFIQHRLFRALDVRTKILSMITHDLKSPITRLRLRYDLRPIENKDNLEDIDLLESLCNQILLETKNDMFECEKVEIINITSLLEKITHDYDNIAIDIKDNVYLKGKKISLYRAFENLISNSKKYSDKVLVSIIKSGYFVNIKIKDYGEGIKETEIKNIFRPFYQVNSMKKGHGLGLTIAQEVITNHDGYINISNHYDPHGVIVNVKLPL
ncbi:HAMP domain-containing sensor histidine kinase [Francisella sp. 19X1-34]|uniref:sensor histidine kinase n=1 Tax=Francisella sp. 19X1-34 TaxID=3087177 RepID=UPI002E3045E9|nr:HAMP domain-containing sensor histidine kinase [Francisella sp. 19X1-34]MED7788864.1 HAMP domain-containing sensor histidine kinase [Francisella sp. 19X1-34]